MRKVIVGAMVSMDGVMQAPGGPEEDPTGNIEARDEKTDHVEYHHA